MTADDGKLSFSSTSTGSTSYIEINNFSGTTAADLGLTTTATYGADATTGTSLSVATQTGADAALTALDTAIDQVSQARADIGALESRFGFRSEQIATSIENLQAANSAIIDTDVAAESSKLASAKVKTQAAVAAAAQASQMPQDLLKLLQ
ncbi:flagellin [Devosia sp. CN2-171]|uniref:flagellin n=1 Tax=Devosia sp. CN2-171 TaxID=3400909 RepID=UPI003BF7EB49